MKNRVMTSYTTNAIANENYGANNASTQRVSGGVGMFILNIYLSNVYFDEVY